MLKKITLIFSLLLFSSTTWSQSEKVFKIVEVFPRFKSEECEGLSSRKELNTCSQAKMLEFISSNLKYPEKSRKKGHQGTVVINMIISSDGSIKNAKIYKAPSKKLGKEALRVIQLMPNWVPGEQDGEKVATYFNVPVRFSI